MSKLNVSFNILYPTFIERIVVWFLLRWRKIHYGYEFRRIALTQGKYAIVDPEDYDNPAYILCTAKWDRKHYDIYA